MALFERLVEISIPAAEWDTCYPYGKKDGCIVSYFARGHGRVDIPESINPWQVLGLHSSNASRNEIKSAFKVKTTQSERQNRAMASVAYHILTSPAGRYVQKCNSDEFVITKPDHFVLAACGHTRALTSKIRFAKHLLKDKDERGRTLLYITSRSGFYDTCEVLLGKGASVNEVQSTGSTPLHGAAYYGHTPIVGLFLQHGAKTDIKNQFNHTALDESATPEIREMIQTASADTILSLTAKFRGKNLVHRVQLIKYQGEVVAKELTRDHSALDEGTRAQWDDICRSWTSAWHGTRYEHLEEIIKNGLLPAGSNGIKPKAGHFDLNKEYLGIPNWAAAIFLSPCIFYSSNKAYSERVLSESQQWCILVKAFCKPGSFMSYKSTVINFESVSPDPEIRVPVEDLCLLRVESARNVVVYSLMFVRLSFLENKHMNLDEKMKILSQEKNLPCRNLCSVS